ncbi:hypothetical protein D3C87_1716440 [compost metagenome]
MAAAVGAAAVGGGVWWLQGLRIDAAVSRAETAELNERNAKHDLTQCKAATARQNSAIAELEERAKRAALAMAAADAARLSAEQRADKILSEREPAGVDECTAARNAFAAELRQERGQ